jgi:hypothetical protein
MKGCVLLIGEIIKKCKNKVESHKKLLLKNHKLRFTQKPPYIVQIQLNLYKSWSLGVGWGHNGDAFIFFKKLKSSEPAGQYQSNLIQIILV